MRSIFKLIPLGLVFFIHPLYSGEQSLRLLSKQFLNGLREPSGLVFHPPTQTLILVGDEGTVEERTLEGKVLRRINLGKRDFEAVAWEKKTDRLFLLDETGAQILELTYGKLALKKTHYLKDLLPPKLLDKKSKLGWEGLTFLPDGALLLAAQSRQNQGAFAFHRFVNWQSAPLPAALGFELKDISDIYANTAGDLFILQDEANLLTIIHPWGAKEAYKIPGGNQEGVTQSSDGRIWICDEQGALFSFSLP